MMSADNRAAKHVRFRVFSRLRLVPTAIGIRRTKRRCQFGYQRIALLRSCAVPSHHLKHLMESVSSRSDGQVYK